MLPTVTNLVFGICCHFQGVLMVISYVLMVVVTAIQSGISVRNISITVSLLRCP